MLPHVTHNPAVMQEVSPATVTLTISTKGAQALAALLGNVAGCDLDDYDLDFRVIRELANGPRQFTVRNEDTRPGQGLCLRIIPVNNTPEPCRPSP
jgi:hypothetical protein